MKLSDELSWRGFINQTTYKDTKLLDESPITFYWGVDPSADSMTIGNLAIAMMVRQFVNAGHKAVLLVGGATGLIGDPDGKVNERDLKSPEIIAANKQKIVAQYNTIFAGQIFEVVDNYDWFKGVHFIEFLRDVGKHVPLRQMLSRDFVQARIGNDGAGISYAEFSYSLIQAYDFLHLHQEKNVSLQVCGADQWGNSIAGVDLIRRVTGAEAHVWSAPIIINKTTGIKFGKSEDGAVWLDAQKTSPYKFYQFWLNVDDAGVVEYLKIYTPLEEDFIAHVLDEFKANKKQRLAQKTLAYEVTKLIHGEVEAQNQERIAQALAGEASIGELEASALEVLKGELPTSVVGPVDNLSVAKALVDTKLASSMSDARRLMSDQAVYINGSKLGDVSDFSTNMGSFVLLRKGKALKDTALIEIK
jgi:tyrosyl-tRNA synthetase